MKSIVQSNKECFFCKTVLNLHKHHVFGGPNRNLSEKYGLWVYLCAAHHNMGSQSVHMDRKLDLMLKKHTQMKYERNNSREEFIKIFGKNYI